jgi:iron complex outermembrane receptor protein
MRLDRAVLCVLATLPWILCAFATLPWIPELAAADEPVLPPVVVEERRLELLPERGLDAEEARELLERTPGGVALVPEERIERTRGASLEDALEAVPGVYVRARGTGEEPQISIRGSGLRSNFHTRGVNVLIDGFPFQNADGFSDVESFEFLAARRVEVYKGANSLRFGGNTLGGAINIVTRTGEDAEPFRARSEGGSFGFWKTFLSTGFAADGWDGYLALSHTQQAGYRDHADQDRQRGYASLGYRFGSGASLRLDLAGVRNRQELPGPLSPAEFDDDPREANQSSSEQDEARDFEYGRSALTLSVPLGENTRLEWQGQVHYQDLWHPLSFGIIDNETLNAGSELRVASATTLFGRDNLVRAGLQIGYTRQPQEIHVNDEGRRGATFSDQLARAANVALYAVDEFALCESLSLVGGLRVQWAGREVEDELADDEDSVDWVFATPSFGAIWRFAEGFELYGNVGHMVEPGVIFELTAPGNLDGDLDDLDPQRAWQMELGVRGGIGERVHFDLAIYDIELEDEIRNVNVDPTGMGFFTIPRYENIDRSRHWGVEVGVDLLLAEGLAARLGLPGQDELRFTTAYTFSRFRFVDDDEFGDHDLPGAPRHFLHTELRASHSSGFWLAPSLELVPTGWYVDSENDVKAPDYTLWNLRLGYDHEPSGLSLFVEGRNLGGEEYVSAVFVDAGDGRYFEPGDGRGVYGGLEWRWR